MNDYVKIYFFMNKYKRGWGWGAVTLSPPPITLPVPIPRRWSGCLNGPPLV